MRVLRALNVFGLLTPGTSTAEQDMARAWEEIL